jgi:predicted transcriptional regulator
LEIRVLEVLWNSSTERSVRDLQPEFPNLAYTTLMTTLDRLYTKGVLVRRKKSRAYLYSPRFAREELEANLVKDAFDTLLGPMETGGSLRPVLTSFVEAVSGRDELLLDELEELIRIQKRATDSEQDEA